MEEIISDDHWSLMSIAAWNCRKNAYLIGKTAVGASVLSSEGKIFAGCNVEHIYRCHDLHAETNAISTMISYGHKRALAILVVAERELFTPCGGCMDWIFQFGSELCWVAHQSTEKGEIKTFKARELMPYYPR